jgi:hypothetical protein
MQEYNIDCSSQRIVIVKGEIGIFLKREVRQFSSLLPGTVRYSADKVQVGSCPPNCARDGGPRGTQLLDDVGVGVSRCDRPAVSFAAAQRACLGCWGCCFEGSDPSPLVFSLHLLCKAIFSFRPC